MIHCVLLLLVTFGLWCQLEPADSEVWGALVLLPVFSRCLSAFGALSLPNARGSGMLASVTGGEQRRPGRWGLLLGSLLCAAALAALEPWFLLAAGAGYLSFACYGVRRHHRGPVRVVFAAVRALIPGRSGAGPAAGGAVMILVVGGLGAGKRRFILEELGYVQEQLSSIPEEGTPVLWGLEALDPLPPLEDLLGREVVACREVGCGVVPMDRADRDRREAVGRLCCDLAARAEAVYRVNCGIAMQLK